ncbi:hypothetical protein [Metabacillus arenae]|uniref:Uncharacterized protein n=1 Tax=Metabacillus arenae TaxID=2771434 RepID=A0A926NDB3_9BACI|nr:hypothetical protein [Metabacillus arenae]MBD1378750.1 hypothetical protein [Metabacillus arenae]
MESTSLIKVDSITLKNDWTNKEETWIIKGIADIYIGNQVYLEKIIVNKFIGIPENGYTGIWSIENPDD